MSEDKPQQDPPGTNAPRLVQCRKYGELLPGLDRPPMPGPGGQDLFENVSARAWQEWQELQTMLINEKHLSVRDPDARKYLNEQRRRFFANEQVDRADGFIDPDATG